MRNPNCRNPKCRVKPETHLTGERDDCWIFQCQVCKALQIRTKPPLRERVRIEQAVKLRDRRAAEERKREARTRYFL